MHAAKYTSTARSGKLDAVAIELAENGLEQSFGHYVASELLRIAEPRRGEIRRSIITMLTNENKLRIGDAPSLVVGE